VLTPAGQLQINRQRYEISVGRKMLLPIIEFELLSVLALRSNHVFKRELLIK
jgi:two-component system, OmpR family, response regulator